MLIKMSRHRTVTALICVSAVAFGACGDDDAPSAGSPESEPAPDDASLVEATAAGGDVTTDDDDDAVAPTPATPGDTAAGGPAPGTTPRAGATDDSWRTAIPTAEVHAGGTAYELDDQDDDGAWEIDVAVGDRSVEVTVGAGGTQVVDTDDDDLNDDDRRALAAATITLVDAITTALGEVGGNLDDAELDDDDGTFVWEVTVDEQGDDDVEVYVDVTTGAVVRVERD